MSATAYAGCAPSSIEYITSLHSATDYRPGWPLLWKLENLELPACKKTDRWGAGVVICLERGADLHTVQLMPLPLTVSCFSKIQIGFTFLYRLTWVVLEKGPLNGCVCLCVCVCVPGLFGCSQGNVRKLTKCRGETVWCQLPCYVRWFPCSSQPSSETSFSVNERCKLLEDQMCLWLSLPLPVLAGVLSSPRCCLFVILCACYQDNSKSCGWIFFRKSGKWVESWREKRGYILELI